MEYKNFPDFKPWNYEEPKNKDPWCLNFKTTSRTTSNSSAGIDSYYQQLAYHATRSASVLASHESKKWGFKVTYNG